MIKVNYIPRIFVLILIMSIIIDCAPFTKTKMMTDQTLQARTLQIKAIGIIVDACAEEIVSRGFYRRSIISIQNSRQTARYVIDGTSDILVDRGYEPNYQSSPFICSTQDKTKKYKVFFDEKNRTEVESQWPFDIDFASAVDKEYLQVLGSVQHQTYLTVKSAQKSGHLSGLRVDIPETDLKIVYEKVKSDALLFIFQEGTYDPGYSEAMRQSVTIGLLSGGACAGGGNGEPPTVHTMAALVDMQNGQLLWVSDIKHWNSGFMKSKYYELQKRGWSSSLFTGFPVNNKQ